MASAVNPVSVPEVCSSSSSHWTPRPAVMRMRLRSGPAIQPSPVRSRDICGVGGGVGADRAAGFDAQMSEVDRAVA